MWHDKETEQCIVTSVADNDETGHNSEWKLSANDLLQVKKAWSYKKKFYFNAVSTFDLKTLRPSNWLNDNVINAFMDIISGEFFSSSTVHAFSSYLYTVLRNERWRSSVLRASFSVDIKAFEILLFPIHNENHWQLIAVFPKSCLLLFFDSMLRVSLTAMGFVLGF